jgi:hypothetical protein
MNKRRNSKSNQGKSKKYGRIMRCSYHTKPVFDNDFCNDFVNNINKDKDNKCINCKHSF